MLKNYDFVRGHCGLDVVTLLYGEQIPEGQEIEIALKLLRDPVTTNDSEIGFLYKPENDEDMRLRIVDRTTRTWLPMCGGMSQFLGLAAVSSKLKDHFSIKVKDPETVVKVITDAGPISLKIEINEGQPGRIFTDMTDYAAYLYKNKVYKLKIDNLEVIRSGYFLVIKIDDLEAKYPGYNFADRTPGPQWQVLRDITAKYIEQEKLNRDSLYVMLYDKKVEAGADARIFSRFYRVGADPEYMEYEIQCGTGTIAVTLAMLEKGDLNNTNTDMQQLEFEWGSKRIIKDPYVMRKSIVPFRVKNNQIADISFNHSVIELISEGKLYLPDTRF